MRPKAGLVQCRFGLDRWQAGPSTYRQKRCRNLSDAGIFQSEIREAENESERGDGDWR